MHNEQIIQGCIKRDSRAQKNLYDAHAPRMMGVCLRYCKNEEEAKDLLQEGFIKVFDKISTYRGEGSLEGWIKKVFITTALEKLREKKIVFERLTDENLADAEPGAVDTKLEAKELLKLIQLMPDGYRVVFNMYAIEGFSHPEIAEKLNITPGTSKSQYARARQHLQKLLMMEKI